MKFVAYTDKSSAKRGLGRKFPAHKADADNFVRQENDKWGFYVNDDGASLLGGDGESVLTDVDVKEAPVDEPAPAPVINYVWPGAKSTARPDPELAAAQEEAPAPAHDAFSRFMTNQLTAEPRPAVVSPAELPTERAPVITKIEKNRPEQNGVKRPSAGTVCAAVWDLAASLSDLSESGLTPHTKVASLGEVTKAAEARGINKYTARTQYARWRVFNGITGRLS